jgi:hypothetical protein
MLRDWDGERKGTAGGMTVTDPDVPNPLNDPRTLQADPGAVAEGEDLASAEDDGTATGEDELAGGDVTGGAAGRGLLPGDPLAPDDLSPDDLTGDDLTGGTAGV